MDSGTWTILFAVSHIVAAGVWFRLGKESAIENADESEMIDEIKKRRIRAKIAAAETYAAELQLNKDLEVK